MPIPELLAPGGNLEKLKIALLYGADAVYIGGGEYGLRARAGNFSPEEMVQGIAFAHDRGKKIYVTVNIYAQNRHFKGLPDYLKSLQELQVDGLLVSDPGIFALAKEVVPELPLHISTQANTQNTWATRFWAQAGAQRVVLGREVGLTDIRAICRESGTEVEIFVHGAMCMAYSGRCLLSSYLTGRSGNLGDCAQPCRWQYVLEEAKRPGEYFPIVQDTQGSYIMNSKDLCLLGYLPQLIDAGVASLKIEGRMKSAYYVANVVRVYRAALDAYRQNPVQFTIRQEWFDELEKVSHRPYMTGFIADGTDGILSQPEMQDTLTAQCVHPYDFVGLVYGYDQGCLLVEQRNHFRLGDTLDFLIPLTEAESFTVTSLFDEDGISISSAPHAQQLVRIPYPKALPVGSILRRPIREKGACKHD